MKKNNDSAAARERTKKYGKVLETFVIHGEGWSYEAEMRLSSNLGNYQFTGYCQLQPERMIGNVSHPEEVCLVRGTDVNQVRKDLTKQVRAKVQVEWAPHIHLWVDTGDGDNARSHAGLVLGYDFVLLGKRPDGSACYKEHAKRAEKRETMYGDKVGEWYSLDRVNDGTPIVGSPQRSRYDTRSYSLLPYSEELHARIDQLLEQLKQLRTRVEGLLTGTDNAAITANLLRTNLLPAPKAS